MRANHQGRKERDKPSQDVYYGLSRLVNSACDRFFENRGMSKPVYNGVPKKSGKTKPNNENKR